MASYCLHCSSFISHTDRHGQCPRCRCDSVVERERAPRFVHDGSGEPRHITFQCAHDRKTEQWEVRGEDFDGYEIVETVSVDAAPDPRFVACDGGCGLDHCGGYHVLVPKTRGVEYADGSKAVVSFALSCAEIDRADEARTLEADALEEVRAWMRQAISAAALGSQSEIGKLNWVAQYPLLALGLIQFAQMWPDDKTHPRSQEERTARARLFYLASEYWSCTDYEVWRLVEATRHLQRLIDKAGFKRRDSEIAASEPAMSETRALEAYPARVLASINAYSDATAIAKIHDEAIERVTKQRRLQQSTREASACGNEAGDPVVRINDGAIVGYRSAKASDTTVAVKDWLHIPAGCSWEFDDGRGVVRRVAPADHDRRIRFNPDSTISLVAPDTTITVTGEHTGPTVGASFAGPAKADTEADATAAEVEAWTARARTAAGLSPLVSPDEPDPPHAHLYYTWLDSAYPFPELALALIQYARVRYAKPDADSWADWWHGCTLLADHVFLSAQGSGCMRAPWDLIDVARDLQKLIIQGGGE